MAEKSVGDASLPEFETTKSPKPSPFRSPPLDMERPKYGPTVLAEILCDQERPSDAPA